MSDNVKIVEVGPRDGLQNELETIPTEIKLELIQRLAQAGLRHIEITSFVSAKWIPQMADHLAVASAITHQPGVIYSALTPNEQGAKAAIAANLDQLAVFTAASEAFSQKNTNCSIEESFNRIADIMPLAKQANKPVRGYLSCVLGCPYSGAVPLNHVAKCAKQLYELGCDEISLGDTIGVGTPNQAKQLIQAVSEHIPIKQLAIHFHDTYGQALANIHACLELGIRTIDSATAGLGGCPYAPGAGGNVATEDVVYLTDGLGLNSGVDLNKLTYASQLICKFLNIQPRSKAAIALSLAKYPRF